MQLAQHGNSVEQTDCFDLVEREPDALQKTALVNAFDFIDALIDDVQLTKGWEVLKPIHPIDVVQAEINRLGRLHILLIDP